VEVKSGRQEFEKLAMEKTKKTRRKTLPAGIAKVLKRLHYPVGVRWYVAYSLSTRNLEEMMAERGLEASLRAAGTRLCKPTVAFAPQAFAMTVLEKEVRPSADHPLRALR
jgi:hypothetical protein